MMAIEIIDLTKRYHKKRAVEALTLSIEEGELFSLLGINGAGKTTTIKMLSCLITPTSGDAFLHGHSIMKKPHLVKKKINISPQETAVAPNLSVRENLELIAEIYGSTKKNAEKEADEMLITLSLTEVAHERAKRLSGGMQRRLSIAMALISRPEILFLDEPTLGLDVLARRELWSMIERLKGDCTILWTTHYMEEAYRLSDRIGIMANGTLKAVGEASELISFTGTSTFEDAFVALATEKEVIL